MSLSHSLTLYEKEFSIEVDVSLIGVTGIAVSVRQRNRKPKPDSVLFIRRTTHSANLKHGFSLQQRGNGRST